MSGSSLLQYIALDRMDVVFATKEVRSRTAKADVLALLLLKRVAKYLVGHREVAINYPYQDKPSQVDCYTDADWAGDVTTRLSTTTGALMHGAHWLEGLSVTQKVRALSSGESEFYAQGSGAARGLLMKHICHEAGETTKSLVLHCDSVASRGMAQWLGCWEMSQDRSEIAVVTTSHGRKEVGNETRSDRVNTLQTSGRRGLTSDRMWKTDEPDGNEFGCWGGVSLCSSQWRKPRGRRFLTVA